MPPGNTPNNSDNRKAVAAAAKLPAQENCPRCDSRNTKFCYYNNYSLTQPRHFCKSCRRYWTKGGALRNVPIGGGCRKNRRSGKPSRSSDSGGGGGSSSSSSELIRGGLKFLHGLTQSPMDFNLGGLLPHLPQQPPIGFYNSSFGDVSSAAAAAAATADANSGFHQQQQQQQLEFPLSGSSCLVNGLNYPLSGGLGSGNIQGLHGNYSLASSIESLSSLNQDLHWKLQQQRLGMLQVGCGESQLPQQRPPQPILFQNLQISKPAAPAAADESFSIGGGSREEGSSGGGGGGDTPTEWFFGNSYGSVAPTPTTTSSGGGGNGHDNNNASNNWSGGGGGGCWGDVQQQQPPYSSLP